MSSRTIWCLYSLPKYNWGKLLHARAILRGWDSRLFKREAEVSGDGYAFCRIAQWEPYLSRDRATAQALLRRGINVIQGESQIRLYEDKVGQAREYARWMPASWIILNRDDIETAIDELGLPVVSKSAHGSSCANVRIIKTKEQALAEADAVFGDGLKMAQGQMQKGYLLWQKFLAENKYIYRVGICGRLKWMFREGNRPGSQLASGSGIYTPIHSLNGETRDVFDAATAFWRETKQNWVGLDYAKDPDTGEWKVLETTLAWGMIHPGSTRGCTLFDEQGRPTGRLGAELWDALLDEIEAGSFDDNSNRMLVQV